MRETDQEVGYVRFEHVAPDEIWAEVTSLFVLCFAAHPYNESADELQSIVQWGPEKLASPGGRLVVTRHDGQLVGFALSQRLDQDSSWLQRLNGMPPMLDLDILPSRTLVVQELAVNKNFRGRGIAKQCIRELLSNRAEQDAVLGVFGQATQVREMYRHWGFSELGTSPIYGGTVTLHALHHKLPWTA
ncbi:MULTISPECIES: GNAT family N-acetyltransferase [Glutamicibacter]|uniref:GNAT-family acetyltransferase n=1 Tax=Glutamicibacter arilaitensis (strain DSM 16368 / CIP 108037 / IAM 15318 / JCM 13566 / NCIMB 14258 / Re117) TaxID=861360 RepID=A0ABP1U137_GLUAR|nr:MULTISPECIES: GNAT family N-acetyltransferase [Glutamicibacter]CBT75117.1 putative GNAT-family acetyltransferase [Glutamicibacter arilaitensis Re117]HCH47238.1 N-acetyltransferase [Glutamicibacter sp.]